MASAKARRVSVDMLKPMPASAGDTVAKEEAPPAQAPSTEAVKVALPAAVGPALAHPVRAGGRKGRRPPSRANAVASTSGAGSNVERDSADEELKDKRERFAASMREQDAMAVHEAAAVENQDASAADVGVKARKSSMVPAGSKALIGELSGVLLKKTSSTGRAPSPAVPPSSSGKDAETAGEGGSADSDGAPSKPEWMVKLKSKRSAEDVRGGDAVDAAKDGPPPGMPAWKWELEQRKAKQSSDRSTGGTSSGTDGASATHKEKKAEEQSAGPPPGVPAWKWELDQRKAKQHQESTPSTTPSKPQSTAATPVSSTSVPAWKLELTNKKANAAPSSASKTSGDADDGGELAALLRKRREAAG